MKSLARIFGLVAIVIACFGLMGSFMMLFVIRKDIWIPLFYIALLTAGIFALKFGSKKAPSPTTDP